jgi:membrane-bound metal-dependent hydrolase YbcI (DUF457 family)
MLAKNHATMAGLTTALAIDVIDPRITLAHRLFVVVIGAGAGVLNDIDQPGSRVARSLGWVTGILAHVIRRLAGGHREGTHCFAGEALFASVAGVSVALIHDRAAQWTLGVLLAILFACVLEMLGVRILRADILAGVAAFAVVWFRYDLEPVGWAVLLGTITHAAGDSMTKAGTQPFLPFSHLKVWLLPRGLRLTTGKRAERYAVAPAMTLGLVVLLAYDTGLLSWALSLEHITLTPPRPVGATRWACT